VNEPERWQRVKELLDAALDLRVEERAAFLVDACGEDDALLEEVNRLLEASEPAWDVLERPAAHLVPSPDPDIAVLEGLEGTLIDAYRMVRLIGVGGMGVVYEAERTGDVPGRVAVKLIKRGMDSELVERRFRYERQILARLTHPNIAHFIDGGVTTDGQPYFVMELVDGEPITLYSTRHELSMSARVRLFLQVLEAVGFAHEKLVVHRDVKPSNVLVSAGGRVKLLDFGVAKVLGDDDQPEATITRVGGRVLTPSYSSPEQIRGEPVTTAADVYSLGVLLYELLAGQKPFELDTEPLSEVQRIVSFDEPTRPSSAVTTGTAGTTGGRSPSRRLSNELSGDLDAIVLKALRKEPGRRYTSAQEFHDDLCRYLDGLPVLARRGTLTYRASKFVRRYRTAVAVVGALLVAAAVGGGLIVQQAGEASRQRARAEQRMEDVRELVNTLLFEVHDAVADLPGSTGARMLILQKAADRLADVQADLPEDPDLLIQLADGFRRLGDVQGRATGPSMGDVTAALGSYRQALPLAERAVALDPDHHNRRRTLGLIHERMAVALANTGDIAEGVAASRHAQEIYESIASAFPDSVRHQLTAVIGRINLSDLEGHPAFPNLGLVEAATRGYREAADRLDREPLATSDSYGVRRYKGLVPERIARMLRLDGRLAESRAEYLASLAVRQALHRENPADDDAWRDIPVTHSNLCKVDRMLGELGRAEVYCQLALSAYERRHQSDPLNAQGLSDLGSVNQALHELAWARGDTALALAHLQQRIEWSELRLERDTTHLPSRTAKLDALLTRALIEARRGVPVTARAQTAESAAALAEDGHLSDGDAARLDSLAALTGPPR